MSERVFHPATAREAAKLTRPLVAAKCFADAAEFEALRAERPWSLQVSDSGDVMLLGRWREHQPYLSVEALWCAQTAIPAALRHSLDVAGGLGMSDVVSPPVQLEETRPYERAGMRPVARVTTLSRAVARRQAADDAQPDMPAGVMLRPASFRDIPGLIELDAACFEPFWHYDSVHLARFCVTGRLVIAERDGVALGYTLTTLDGTEGLLGRLCVTPQSRRQGIGRALVADSVRWVREQGGAHVTLSTQTDNEASRALYRRAGLKETGRVYAFMRFGTEEGRE